MKPVHKPSRRLPAHVAAVVADLKRCGAEIIRIVMQRRVRVIWRIAGRVFSALISATVPDGGCAEHYAARECNRVRSICNLMPARA